MAMLRRFPVRHEDVFPNGSYLVGEVEAVLDFNAGKSPDGSLSQQVDKESGLLVWSVQVRDADELAGKKDKSVTVKFAAPHQPMPPANDTPFPLTPVEFIGLTALPWVDDSAVRVEDGKIRGRSRIAWSFKAEGMAAPGQARKAGASASSGSGSEKAAGRSGRSSSPGAGCSSAPSCGRLGAGRGSSG